MFFIIPLFEVFPLPDYIFCDPALFNVTGNLETLFLDKRSQVNYDTDAEREICST